LDQLLQLIVDLIPVSVGIAADKEIDGHRQKEEGRRDKDYLKVEQCHIANRLTKPFSGDQSPPGWPADRGQLSGAS
jgi:hypothetical protein